MSSLSSNDTYWTFVPPANTFTNNRKYTFVVEAIDAAGLVQSNYGLGVSSFTIIYDTAAPNVTISAPATTGGAYFKTGTSAKGVLLLAWAGTDLIPEPCLWSGDRSIPDVLSAKWCFLLLGWNEPFLLLFYGQCQYGLA